MKASLLTGARVGGDNNNSTMILEVKIQFYMLKRISRSFLLQEIWHLQFQDITSSKMSFFSNIYFFNHRTDNMVLTATLSSNEDDSDEFLTY